VATLFTRIIEGELPGRFVWKDDSCVAFLSIHPLRPGHTLVVPRAEIDHWLDLEASLLAHLMETAQSIGKAQMAGFKPARVGVVLAGLEVPHCHIHVVPIEGVHDLDFDRQDLDPDPAEMDRAAATIRRELGRLGFPAGGLA
jgi:histidine triad (HIT) family protein